MELIFSSYFLFKSFKDLISEVIESLVLITAKYFSSAFFFSTLYLFRIDSFSIMCWNFLKFMPWRFLNNVSNSFNSLINMVLLLLSLPMSSSPPSAVMEDSHFESNLKRSMTDFWVSMVLFRSLITSCASLEDCRMLTFAKRSSLAVLILVKSISNFSHWAKTFSFSSWNLLTIESWWSLILTSLLLNFSRRPSNFLFISAYSAFKVS
ncbi:hypothetical protein WICPIJ_004848 [Wickerhamomyces pijperi]|uniref:Uncharacterized protein n=1 Tax=Wickerhamomyces pijperi TaxID=599730 RepID=A0A9P8Q754_WICPI|nr:hypothetical protein WICPIJ_004848 [Wickerhamomyces pijperi]